MGPTKEDLEPDPPTARNLPLHVLRQAITQYNSLISGICRDYNIDEQEVKAIVARVLEWYDNEQ